MVLINFFLFKLLLSISEKVLYRELNPDEYHYKSHPSADGGLNGHLRTCPDVPHLRFGFRRRAAVA